MTTKVKLVGKTYAGYILQWCKGSREATIVVPTVLHTSFVTFLTY